MIDLKPCPFCGGEATVTQQGIRLYSTIYDCTNCHTTHETGETRQVPQLWNTRPLEEKQQAIIQKLTEALEKTIIYIDALLQQVPDSHRRLWEHKKHIEQALAQLKEK